MTSEFEGLPMSVLEAMALGRPVLAMRVGGLAELVDDGRTGVLVAPGDVDAFARALAGLARESSAVRRELGAAAREEFERRFTLERMVDDYAQMLSELVL